MIGKRCQVCDGEIVNGRCRLCGMPYRNDEILYHLNESRSDHIRHATPKAKEIMRKQQVPQKDRQDRQKPQASREEIRAHQQQVRKEAVERMTGTKQVSPGSGNPGSKTGGRKKQKSSYGTLSGGTRKEKRVSSAGVILVLIIVLCAVLPGVSDYIKTEYKYSWSKKAQNQEDFYMEEDEDGSLLFSAGGLTGEFEVGPSGSMPAGTYQVYVWKGAAVIEVKKVSGTKEYEIPGQDNVEKNDVMLILKSGDTIRVTETSGDAKRVYFRLLSETSA